ncbi:hypothetical protein J8273_7537 [Carpediemonas membranifera]|uniref:Uncharacterized protein n=1 Tax=Carpediemonas membranifera TaxID=201153 RepID=A0A8J6AY37_9EUKA|nr:hypothetical protein J8273_7537 [Carpediemonas membranifera]|eukprot:KAG9391263.1 hypothetical protein J8273_7537 [Carpediemonas membranifera]
MNHSGEIPVPQNAEIPQLSCSSAFDLHASAEDHDFENTSFDSMYNAPSSCDHEKCMDHVFSSTALQPFHSVSPSYSSLAEQSSDYDSDLGMLGITSIMLGDTAADEPDARVLSNGWAFTDITESLQIPEGKVSEAAVKAAVKETRDSSYGAWISRGSIRAWCTQCQAHGRHKMLVLRYRCARTCCDAVTCTLQSKYLYCPVSKRVFFSTSGDHTELAAPTARRQRGITVQLKRFIESLVEQGKTPSTISSDLQSTMGEESPSLRQIQNYVFRFKKKRESRRISAKSVGPHLPPATLAPSPPQTTVSIVSSVSNVGVSEPRFTSSVGPG